MTHLTAATVYEAIAHGDDTHRAWLNEALENLWEGKPVPGPRGTNVPTDRAVMLDLLRAAYLTLWDGDSKARYRMAIEMVDKLGPDPEVWR